MNVLKNKLKKLIKCKDGYFSSELYIVGVIVFLFGAYAVSKFFLNQIDSGIGINNVNLIITDEVKSYIFFGITVIALSVVLTFCIIKAIKINQ